MTLNWTKFDQRSNRGPTPRSKFIAGVDAQIGFCQTWLNGGTPKGSRGGAADVWWIENEGTWAIRPKYGPKPLIGPGGSNAISAGKKSNILAVLKELKQEAESGRLDEMIEEAVNRKSRRSKKNE